MSPTCKSAACKDETRLSWTMIDHSSLDLCRFSMDETFHYSCLLPQGISPTVSIGARVVTYIYGILAWWALFSSWKNSNCVMVTCFRRVLEYPTMTMPSCHYIIVGKLEWNLGLVTALSAWFRDFAQPSLVLPRKMVSKRGSCFRWIPCCKP